MECSICLEEIQCKTKIELHNCKHVFHKKCIFLWKFKNNTCPMCRSSIKFCYQNMLKEYIQFYYENVYNLQDDLSKLTFLTFKSSKTINYIKKISIYYVIIKILEKGDFRDTTFLNLFFKKLTLFKKILPNIIKNNDKYSENLLKKMYQRVEKII